MLPDVRGIGVDIEDISRFRELAFEENKNFYERIFTEGEIGYCLSKEDPYPSFAVRFCAKEAFMKAAREPIANYRDIEVVVKDKKVAVVWKGASHLLSLSHDKTKAIAFVIIQE